MANLLFKKGIYDDFKSKVLTPKAAVEGALYFTEDEGSLYIGKTDGEVVRVQGTVHQYDTLKAFGEGVTPPYSTDVIYFIAEKNALVRYDGENWIQLNTSAETAAALDTAIKTNAANIATNASGIKTNTDAIASHKTLIDKLREDVDAKATQTDFDALEDRVEANEGNITTLTETVGTKADASTVSDLSSQVGTNTTNIGTLTTGLGALTETVGTKASQEDLNNLTTRVNANETAIGTKAAQTDLDNAVGRIGELETQVGTNTGDISTIKESLKTKVETETFNTLSGKVTTNETNIETLRSQVATKVESEAFNTLAGRVTNNESAIAGHGTAITAAQKDIADLKQADINHSSLIAQKANQSDLTNLTTVVNGLSTTKADTETVNTLSQQVTDMGTTLNNKVDKEAGKGLSSNDFTTAEKEKLAGIAEGATRVLVDDALKADSINPVQNKVIATELSGVKSSLQEQGTVIANIKENYATKESVSELEQDIADINELLGGNADGSSVNDRLSALEQYDKDNTEEINTIKQSASELSGAVSGLSERVGTTETDIAGLKEADTGIIGRLDGLDTKTNTTNTNLSNLTERVTTAEGDIDKLEGRATVLESAVSTLQTNSATKTELNNLSTELKAEIDADIMAANAMVYKGGVSSDVELTAKTPAIGDTYVVTTAFGDYQAGDLLIATSTDGTEVDGLIPDDKLKWDHVSTGYSDIHDPEMTATDNKIVLKDFGGEELGVVTIASTSKNVTVSTSDNTISIGLEWDTF